MNKRVAIIDKNPRTQFAIGHNYPVLSNVSTLVKDVARLKPDWVFISVKSGMEEIRRAIKHTKAAYIYADYRNPLERFTKILSQISDITLTSWKHPELWKQLKNPHVARRGTDINQFYPIPGVEPIYDVVFGGNNAGGKPRMEVLDFVHKHFNLYIVGSGWPKKFNQFGKKAGFRRLNIILNQAKITIGAFNLIDKEKDGASYYMSTRLLQNMAVGRPHLSPYCPGVRELFENGYLEYKSLDNLKYGIQSLLEMPQCERDLIGRTQRKEIMNHHTYTYAWAYMQEIVEENLFGKHWKQQPSGIKGQMQGGSK